MILCFLMTGCASHAQTVHDYCLDHIDRYSSYDECYQEVSATHKNWSAGKKIVYAAALLVGGAGKGLSEAPQNPGPVNCTAFRYGQWVQVSCQ